MVASTNNHIHTNVHIYMAIALSNNCIAAHDYKLCMVHVNFLLNTPISLYNVSSIALR